MSWTYLIPIIYSKMMQNLRLNLGDFWGDFYRCFYTFFLFSHHKCHYEDPKIQKNLIPKFFTLTRAWDRVISLQTTSKCTDFDGRYCTASTLLNGSVDENLYIGTWISRNNDQTWGELIWGMATHQNASEIRYLQNC